MHVVVLTAFFPQARVLSLNADTGAVAALDHLYLLPSLPAASSGKTNTNKNSNKNNKQKKNKSKDEGIDEEAVGEVIVDAARGVIYAHTLAVPPQDLQRAPKVHHLHIVNMSIRLETVVQVVSTTCCSIRFLCFSLFFRTF